MAQHIYLETSPGTGKFKYRGEATANDDPRSFAKKMGDGGLRVEIHDDFKGLEYVKPAEESN
jgi:uncharacterized membrane-anchored protein